MTEKDLLRELIRTELNRLTESAFADSESRIRNQSREQFVEVHKDIHGEVQRFQGLLVRLALFTVVLAGLIGTVLGLVLSNQLHSTTTQLREHADGLHTAALQDVRGRIDKLTNLASSLHLVERATQSATDKLNRLESSIAVLQGNMDKQVELLRAEVAESLNTAVVAMLPKALMELQSSVTTLALTVNEAVAEVKLLRGRFETVSEESGKSATSIIEAIERIGSAVDLIQQQSSPGRTSESLPKSPTGSAQPDKSPPNPT